MLKLITPNTGNSRKQPDKVLYEEIMTNDDNLESSLLTSSLLKMLGTRSVTSCKLSQRSR